MPAMAPHGRAHVAAHVGGYVLARALTVEAVPVLKALIGPAPVAAAALPEAVLVPVHPEPMAEAVEDEEADARIEIIAVPAVPGVAVAIVISVVAIGPAIVIIGVAIAAPRAVAGGHSI